MNNPFESTGRVKQSLNSQKYIASDEIATIVFLSQKLGKPLLTEGPAGVGKTELAKAIAGATGRELIRLQCYQPLAALKLGISYTLVAIAPSRDRILSYLVTSRGCPRA